MGDGFIFEGAYFRDDTVHYTVLVLYMYTVHVHVCDSVHVHDHQLPTSHSHPIVYLPHCSSQ